MTSTPRRSRPDIAAIVPCYNEEATVGKVVSDLRSTFEGITVYVYDNNSRDATRERAREAGAVVRTETLQGKGNVVRRAFADVDADIYVLIDGDDTYDVASAPAMVDALLEGPYDHVLGCRVDDPQRSAYRTGHAWGNRFFNRVVSMLFGEPVTDMLSGFRVFSRRFVKSFPALSQRFEIETELTVHSLATRVPQIEKPVGFGERPDGSESKLSTFTDGRRIILTIGKLFAMEKPLIFWGTGALIALVAGLACGIPVISEYMQTGLVQRFPTAFLAASLMVIACLMATAGVILTGTTRNRHEAARLAYLGLAPVSTPGIAEASGPPRSLDARAVRGTTPVPQPQPQPQPERSLGDR
ncbi:glycosyl transferase [Brachybacterium endophyticum]|uniref:Glycosyl transferase n=1 Tax=Brachybacterium endophyticum TaxID=2182385 RepID=A0A2U2RL00_9MICO|nr:glycosyltransferase [Brachybacterium endophyticum]PWH06540.1 glycosyl transferase [Brachybacterium endophyticum]